MDDHVLQISADKYTPNKEDDIYIPTGNLQVVKQLWLYFKGILNHDSRKQYLRRAILFN